MPDRRRVVIGLLSLPALLAVAACGGGEGDGGEGDGGAGARFTATSADDSGHLHTIEIPCADLGGGRARSYVSDGETHQHTVELSVAELDALAAGETIVVTFTDGHEHTFSIAVPADAC